jgi:aminoglycoside phosphotransferase (APT) family kinase protein
VTGDAALAVDQLDWSALESYLRQHLFDKTNVGRAEMRAEQFPGGHSNLTYLVSFGDVDVVVRRPPLGPLPARAHDMAREFRWLAALHPRFPLAPRPLLLCDDASVVGCVFYVMERRHGEVIRHEEPSALCASPASRRRVSEAVVDTLASLHSVQLDATLAALGKPQGFVSRQVRGWAERWHRAQTSSLPEMDALAAWLDGHLPVESAPPTVVHGDYKLDNVMLDAREISRVTAVLDWEMSALGDPLVDLGILLAYWSSESLDSSEHDALSTVTSRPGWFSAAQIVERYESRSGRNVSGMAYYEVLALFKVAVVLQQLYARFLHGHTGDQRLARLERRVSMLARRASARASM